MQADEPQTIRWGREKGQFGGAGGAGVIERGSVSPASAAAAHRRWWDEHAREYLAEHGDTLANRLQWGPEGVSEAELGLMGAVAGRTILEVGSGAGQCSQWLRSHGAHVIASDISLEMLRAGDPGLLRVQADGFLLPFADQSVDITFSSYGALPFLPDAPAVLREWARVTRDLVIFSVTHPMRWALLDDPEDLTISRSYFDRNAYIERNDKHEVTYTEHHRTIGDWVGAIVSAGMSLEQIVEPEWPDRNTETWGAWSPARGKLTPGTAIFVAKVK